MLDKSKGIGLRRLSWILRIGQLLNMFIILAATYTEVQGYLVLVDHFTPS